MRELKELQEKKDKDIERFTKIPEDHPAYQDEWKKFWCARFKELQNEGKCDPHTYDYKPEWITFWNVRVKEIFDEEFEERKKALKAKYGIGDEEKSAKVSPFYSLIFYKEWNWDIYAFASKKYAYAVEIHEICTYTVRPISFETVPRKSKLVAQSL